MLDVSDVVFEWLPAGWRGRESGVPLWIYISRLGHTGASEDIVLRCALYASQGLGAPTTVSWGLGGGLLTSETMGSPGTSSEVGVDVFVSTGLVGGSGKEYSKRNNCSRRGMAEMM